MHRQNYLDKEWEWILKWLAESDLKVGLYHNDEAGVLKWSVYPVSDQELWFDSFETKGEALDWIKAHGFTLA